MSVRSTATSTSTTFSARRNISGDARTLPPATQIPHGESILLYWEGPSGSHTLFTDYKPDGESVDLPHITQPLTRDTVFTLRTVTNELTRYHTVTVTVDTPELPGLKTDAIRGDLSLSVPGTLTVSGNAVVSGTTKVNGNCTANSIGATGRVETGTVTVTGEVTSSDANSRLDTEELRVKEAETTRSLSISGGPVDLFGAPRVFTGNNTPADGFVVAVHQGEGVELTTSSGSTSTTVQVKGSGNYQWAAGALPVHTGDRVQITPAPTAGTHLFPLGHAATTAAPNDHDAANPDNDHT